MSHIWVFIKNEKNKICGVDYDYVDELPQGKTIFQGSVNHGTGYCDIWIERGQGMNLADVYFDPKIHAQLECLERIGTNKDERVRFLNASILDKIMFLKNKQELMGRLHSLLEVE